MENSDKYITKTQETLCRVMDLLAGAGQTAGTGFPELSLGEIAHNLELKTDKILRTLYLLHQRGWVERNADKRYRLSPYWPRVGYRFGEKLVLEREQARQRLQEFRE